jgi:hypothetical protein
MAPGVWNLASPFAAALGSMQLSGEDQKEALSPGAIAKAVQAQMARGSANSVSGAVVASAPAEPVKMYSTEYYLTCALGGVVSCGATHTAVTPLVSARGRRKTARQRPFGRGGWGGVRCGSGGGGGCGRPSTEQAAGGRGCPVHRPPTSLAGLAPLLPLHLSSCGRG